MIIGRTVRFVIKDVLKRLDVPYSEDRSNGFIIFEGEANTNKYDIEETFNYIKPSIESDILDYEFDGDIYECIDIIDDALTVVYGSSISDLDRAMILIYSILYCSDSLDLSIYSNGDPTLSIHFMTEFVELNFNSNCYRFMYK